MRNLSCLVVDDEPIARKIILEYLNEQADFHVAGECKSAIEAQQILLDQHIDVLFIDISMPNLSGMELLHQLEVKPIVVFITAHPEYAVEAFEVRAFDYLVKPVSFARFNSTLNKIRTEFNTPQQTESNYVNIREGKRTYRVKDSDILYLQAYGDYVRVFTKTKTHLTKDTLMGFSDQLPGSFVRVHRSYVVNIDVINYHEGRHLVIGDTKIPISESHRDQIQSLLR